MKELSVEEKAKRYEEAIKAAKSKIKNDKDHVLYENDILDIFPELNESESEDEKIRKAIINFLHEGNPFKNIKKETRQRWIAWLEKQGLENDIKEDAIHLCNELIDTINKQGEQKHVEWSEEDEKMIIKICQNLYDYPRIKSQFDDESFNEAQKEVQFIKSLRPQNRWKPSEMQLDTIEQIIDGEPHERDLRIKLLKILKG